MTVCLLAEIGGTNARFAVLSAGGQGPIERLQVGMYGDAVQAIRHFLSRHADAAAIGCAVIAAAGPVSAGRCKLTNAAWVLDSEELKRAFRWSAVKIVNDLEAQAWALPRLAPADCVAIGGGHAVTGQPMAIVAPGTGLGMACFVPDGRGHVLPSEGGHATLAAIDRDSAAIIAVLREHHGHVSAERALSGAGLASLYRAVASLAGGPRDAPPPEEITRAGIEGSSATARRALDLFCAFLGSVAGDAALMFGARGGIYLGGGIVPRLVDYLPRSRFRAAFESKGRLAAWVEHVPTRIIMRPEPAFLGLAALATPCMARADP